MSKSKRNSKAKRSRPKRLSIPRDPVTGQQMLFDPNTGKPTFSRPRLSSVEAARIAAREGERLRASRDLYAARRAAFHARLARRPAEMQRSTYRVPDDVAAFLTRLLDDPLKFNDQSESVTVADAREKIAEAYMEGCRQGFIEGFLYGEDKARPGALKNRERLRRQNLDKLARLGIEDRNAEIVAAFGQLEREMPGKEERKEKLAADYELTPRQIGNIISKAKRRR